MASEQDVSKSIGSLVANIVKGVFPNISGLEEALEDLRNGDLSQKGINKIKSQLSACNPDMQLVKAFNKYLARDSAKDAKTLLEQNNYEGLMEYLCTVIQPNDLTQAHKNPYAVETKTAAKRIVGAPINFIFSPGSIESGLVTEAASYSGVGDEHLTIPQAEPGTIGKWHSSRRGGYNVATITAHPVGEKGYIAIFEVTVGNEKLSMGKIPDKFGFLQLEGSNVTDPKSQLKLNPFDRDITYLTTGIKIKSAPTKGTGCTAVYKLALE